jgi:hypothetical protein
VYVKQNPPEPVPDEELAEDAPGFVDAINRLVNLYEVGKGLLTSNDEKIKQRAWEHMLEMKYGKGGPPASSAQAEEPPRLNFEGVFGPVRREPTS